MEKTSAYLRGLACGALQMQPYVMLENRGKVTVSYREIGEERYDTLRLEGESAGQFRDTLYLERKDGAIRCRRVFEVTAQKMLPVCELGLRLSGISFGGAPRDDFFYHNENPRIYETMTFPVDYARTAADAKDSRFDFQAGNRWADPGTVSERIGASVYQPFPAILLSNYGSHHGLVHGTLSQEVCYHNYLVRHEEDTVTLEVLSSFKDVAALELQPGRVIVDEWYLGTTEHSEDIEQIFAGYADALREKLPAAYGRTDINRTSMVWGSWNDGIFRDVSEDMLLREAEYLRNHFPTVRWIQLDDGYATMSDHGAHGLGVPYEGEAGVDAEKFPHGLRHYTDALRAMGMRPALWIGGFCPKPSKLYQEHPDWFMDYDYRVPTSAPLDVSQPQVRAYMENAVQTLCRKYGFDGVKHDFWSYAFEDSHPLFRNRDRSGYEYRRWWTRVMRDVLASDGYYQTGCDIVMGNPFLGEMFTNYRYGIDIGSGNWDFVKTNFLWGAACFATHTGDLFPPNSDAVGLFPGLNEREAMFAINYCMSTHSMVEIAGKLSEAKDENRLRILRKAACNPNNGQDVYFARYDYRDHAHPVPEILYFKTPHFSRLENAPALPLRTFGFFNLSDEAREFACTAAELGLPEGNYCLTDVWSGTQTMLSDAFTVTLDGHGSGLWAVSRVDGIQLYDANFRVNAVTLDGQTLTLETDYAVSEAELQLSHTPKTMRLNGKTVDFTVEKGILHTALSEKGRLELDFD